MIVLWKGFFFAPTKWNFYLDEEKEFRIYILWDLKHVSFYRKKNLLNRYVILKPYRYLNGNRKISSRLSSRLSWYDYTQLTAIPFLLWRVHRTCLPVPCRDLSLFARTRIFLTNLPDHFDLFDEVCGLKSHECFLCLQLENYSSAKDDGCKVYRRPRYVLPHKIINSIISH